MTRFGTCAPMMASVTFFIVACGSGADDGGGKDDALAADAMDVIDSGAEATDDVATDAVEAGPDVAAIPFVPASWPTPVADEPYLQEYNHTSNEVEDWIGPLVSVVLPPASWPDADPVIQVTPRGFARHDWDGEFAVDTIDPTHPDLIGAASNENGLILVSPRYVYYVDTKPSITATAAPDSLTVTGAAAMGKIFFIFTDKGLNTFVPGETMQWHEEGPVVTASLESGGIEYTAGDGWIHAEHPSGKDHSWTADLDTGVTVALVSDVELPASIDLVVVGEKGLVGLDYGGIPVAVAEFANARVPLDQPRAAAKTSDGGFVVATPGGAYRIMDRGHGPEWRVYNAERWLPSEDARAVVTDPTVGDGPIWFATAGGLATVTAKRITLEQKLEAFVERIVQRHDRDGAVSDSHLTKKGDLSTNIPWDSDNDGTWTSYWLMGECLRWKITGDAAAKAHFDKSLDSMLSLRYLTGMDHFVSRAKIRIEGCILDDCDGPNDGEWFKSVDDEWWMKGDTSNDEVIAHVYLASFAYDWCADETQKEAIRDHVRGIVGGLIDNGWQLLDRDGEVTTYGQWDPGYINDSASGFFGDGGVRSAEILAMLTVADYMTGEPRFDDAKRFLMDEYHYDVNAVNDIDYLARIVNMDNDEMDSYSWWLLRRYEKDPALRDRWIEGWTRLYDVRLRMQQAPWWYLMDWTAGGTPTQEEIDYLVRWLRLAPVDMIRWNQHNGHRQDLVPAPYPHSERQGKVRTDGLIIPYDERRCDRWNTDQYRVDGGMGGVIEMDGADVLAPYWLARYYGYLKSQYKE